MGKTKQRVAHSVDNMNIEENAKNKYKGLESSEQTELQITFSTRLNNLLQERGMHQLELCKHTKISEGSISNYRNGKALPKTFELKKLSGCLRVSADYLLGNVDVQSNNTTIKSISCFTGLNTVSIERLNKWENYKKEHYDYHYRIDTINALLSEFQTEKLFEEIDIYVHYVKYCIFLKMKYPEIAFDTKDYKKFYNQERKLSRDEVIKIKLDYSEGLQRQSYALFNLHNILVESVKKYGESFKDKITKEVFLKEQEKELKEL